VRRVAELGSLGGVTRMKKKTPRKFRVFSGNCPECGSDDTHLDLTAVENLKLVPLTAVTSSIIMPGTGTRVRMRCGRCKTKFLG
jgi:hypothetical protein